MKIFNFVFFSLAFIISNLVVAQTDYTDSIVNPSFETGDNTGWTWIGADGYTWIGPNTDGDATKDGNYINGLWNGTIGDVECSQTVTRLPVGFYKISALLSVSTNQLTNQRLFASTGDTTLSVLYGTENHQAYSTPNLDIIGANETYSFGNHVESSAENGPFHKVSLIQKVSNDTIKIGIRVSGKATDKAYDFSYTPKEDAGFFKFDDFTIEDVTNVALLSHLSLSTGSLDVLFDPLTINYTAILPEGTEKVVPLVTPYATGVEISGTDTVDVSSGTGSSVIEITALDGVTKKTYTISYTVTEPYVLEGTQQDRLYTNQFPLGDVKLLDGPFLKAMELNIDHLLQYDVDRLLAPFRKEAGLSAKATSFSNWSDLNGHIAGHYLSAMAIHYAATGDTTCKQLMDYMVDELEACQNANTSKNPSWGVGYAGGVLNGYEMWKEIQSGIVNAAEFLLNDKWVPWYNIHKTYAGLRDAWLYGGNEKAKDIFLAFCDWGVQITSGLSDAQMESMLVTEHGGMNEIFADAYQMTGDAKFLEAAKRFSNKVILNSMAAGVDNLDHKHANTQVPKAVGFQRIAEVSNDPEYINGAEFFWNTVVHNRTLAFGGNSLKEHFPSASSCSDYLNEVEGPESCNTNNMLKLTENLFRVDPKAEYTDYYERALYNHILSTQHPEHGGYVYFTPARPRHYRVYSQPNQAMWCCVGTGMENHGKYGEMIYSHEGDSLYLNLFIASELEWKNKGVVVRQETAFPEEETTQLTISTDNPAKFTLMVRSPKWVEQGALKILVNGDTLDIHSEPQTYLPVDRTWNNGDVVKVILPMHHSTEQLINVPTYHAFMYGPILLGAKTGTDNLTGLVADDSRWGHIASGPMKSLSTAPVVVGDHDSIHEKFTPVEGAALNFKMNDIFVDSTDKDLVLEPFYKIHDARYMIYWANMSKEEFIRIRDSIAEIEYARLALEARTIDHVSPGEQQPEADHNFDGVNVFTGNLNNEFWRQALGGYFSYDLRTDQRTDIALMVRYWGNQGRNHHFNILIDDDLLVYENVSGKWNIAEFVNVEYPIPCSMTKGKDNVTVKFESIENSYAGAVYDVRIVIDSNYIDTGCVDTANIDTAVYIHDILKRSIKVSAANNTIIVKGLYRDEVIMVYDISGRMQAKMFAKHDTEFIPIDQKGLKLVFVVSNGQTYKKKVMIQ